MKSSFANNLSSVKFGLLFALITLVYGFGLGGTFGLFEENIKKHLNNNAKQVSSSVYNGDEAKMKEITDKSWTYFKRAHLHANGLGTASVALIILLSFFTVGNKMKRITALFLGIGSLGYSMYWMFAGLKAPGLGSTGLAKESLAWLAFPSAGLCILGLLMMVIWAVMNLFSKGENKYDSNR